MEKAFIGMGWNGSDRRRSNIGESITAQKNINSRIRVRARVFRFLLVIMAAVLCATLILFCHNEKNDQLRTTRVNRGFIPQAPITKKTVSPVITNLHNEIFKSAASTNNYYRDKNGVLRRPGGMRVVEGPVIKGKLPHDYQPPIFKTAVENEIWNLLTLPLGTVRFGGGRPYSARFDIELRESMKLGDQIKPDDSESVKEQKRLVWEAKKDLIKRMDAGEKLKDIIKESQDEMHTFATYRQNLLNDLDEALSDENLSDSHIDEFISAANAIFKDNGMKTINAKNTLLRRKLLIESKKRKTAP